MSRELDEFLEIELFGWHRLSTGRAVPGWVQEGRVYPDLARDALTPRRLSTTYEGVGLVLEAMRARGFRLHTASFVSIPVSQAVFTTYGDVYPKVDARWFQDDALPMAVALAARAAIESES